MGKVIMSGIVPQLEAPSNYDPVFANNTWEQIIEACQKNKVPETWEVGDQKAMTINGTDYLIDIIGKNHDDYSDGSGKAPMTFQLHDLYGTTYQMNSSNTNSGGWTSCRMRTTNIPAILVLMPSEIQLGLKEVNKLTSEGNRSTVIHTTKDKLFLLSEIEIFGSTSYSATGEGIQYAYYSAGNSRLKQLNESINGWWGRSPDIRYATGFCRVNSSGQADTDTAATQMGVALAFCF